MTAPGDLYTPTAPQSVATKAYVDGATSGGLTQLPVFDRLNSPVNSAKIIVGRASLVGGVANVTLNNGSGFSNVEYECTASNMSAPSQIQVNITSSTAFTITSSELGTAMYICIGN